MDTTRFNLVESQLQPRANFFQPNRLPAVQTSKALATMRRFNIGKGKNMQTAVARKFLISGEVQGVGYRFFAQRAAARHQVVGYVRNCPDGSVEAVVEGPATDVEAFKHDLATGPQWSVVRQVEEISLDPTGRYSSFRIER